MKKAFSILVLVALVLFTGGCYDYSEPDEKAWILAVGLDKGRQNKLTVTFVVAIPKNIAGGGGGAPAAGGAGGGGGTFFTISMESPTLLSSLELVDSVADRRADLSHTAWFVFSRELAEEGIEQYYAPLARFHQFRRSSHIIICEGRAEDFLERGKPVLEDNVSKYYELLSSGWRYTEFIPFDTFHYFYMKSKAVGVEPVAVLAALNREEPVYRDNTAKPKGEYRAGRIPRRGGGKIEVMGGAVFKRGRMVGILNGDQTGVLKLFFGTLRRTVKDVPDPNHPGLYVIVDVKPRNRPRVDVRIGEDGLPEISVRVSLEGSIMSIQSGEHYETPGRLPILEQAVEKAYLEEINRTIAKSQAMESDFLGFGFQAQKLFSTWPQWVDYNWEEKYPGASITVSVDYKVRRIGLLHETMPIR